MKKNESYHQKKTASYLTDLKIQDKIAEFFSVENENPYSKFLDKKIVFKLEADSKAMGKNKGATDLVIVGFDCVHFMEMKDAPRQLKTKISISHTKTSDEQKVFLSNVAKSKACKSVVCYGYDEARDYIDKEILK